MSGHPKPCDNCGKTWSQCNAILKKTGRGCCGACYFTVTHGQDAKPGAVSDTGRTEAVETALKQYPMSKTAPYSGAVARGMIVAEMLAAADAHDAAHGVVRVNTNDPAVIERIARALYADAWGADTWDFADSNEKSGYCRAARAGLAALLRGDQ